MPVSRSVRRIAHHGAHRGGGIAAGQQAPDLGGREGRHDRLGQTHGAEAAEGIVGGGAGGAQPGAEAAHLAEGAVAGGGALGGETGEGGDHVIGAAAIVRGDLPSTAQRAR